MNEIDGNAYIRSKLMFSFSVVIVGYLLVIDKIAKILPNLVIIKRIL